MRKRFWKGLGLIDFTIASSMIGITLGIIIWRYEAFACRSMQSEAKFSLARIYAAQKLYHNEHDRFASLETLLVKEKRLVLPQKYYVFTDDMAPGRNEFRVRANGKKGELVADESWVIDESNKAVCQNKICSK